METLLNLQIILFLLIFAGFLVRRLGIIGEQGQKNMTDLVLCVVLPCNILRAFIVSDTDGMFSSFLSILLISAGIQVFCVFYAKLFFRRETAGKNVCLQYATICSNAGFLGIPISEGVYGTDGMLMANVYLIPIRIMMWSAGITLYTGQKDPKKAMRLVLTHPCIIALDIGLIFMFTGWKLPAGLMGAVTSISSCNTALSMMVIGMILAQINLRTLWDRSILRYSVHRLIIIPAIVFLVCRFLPVSKTVAGVSVLLSAMPAGATTSILAEKYQVEPAFATKIVILSTLLSLPSIAAWSLVLQRM